MKRNEFVETNIFAITAVVVFRCFFSVYDFYCGNNYNYYIKCLIFNGKNDLEIFFSG
jgi:hypothetical protein